MICQLKVLVLEISMEGCVVVKMLLLCQKLGYCILAETG